MLLFLLVTELVCYCNFLFLASIRLSLNKSCWKLRDYIGNFRTDLITMGLWYFAQFLKKFYASFGTLSCNFALAWRRSFVWPSFPSSLWISVRWVLCSPVHISQVFCVIDVWQADGDRIWMSKLFGTFWPLTSKILWILWISLKVWDTCRARAIDSWIWIAEKLERTEEQCIHGISRLDKSYKYK